MLGGDLAVIFGGRLQIDAASFEGDDDMTEAFGEPNDGVEVRRAFLELGALYRERYEARLMMDVSGTGELSGLVMPTSHVDFRDIFLGMLRVPVLGGVRVGYFKEPFGLEEIESSNDITFMERSLTDAMVERRNLGAAINRRFADRRETLSVGVCRDATNELDVRDGYGITGRVTGLPIYGGVGEEILHIGAAATYRVPSDDTLQFPSWRPGTSGWGLKPHTRRALGPFKRRRCSPLHRPQRGPANPRFPSMYVMSSYILTGESRLYRKNVGAFGRVHPYGPYGPWEVVAR